MMQVNKRCSLIGIILVSAILTVWEVWEFTQLGIYTGRKVPKLFDLKGQKVTHIGFLKVHKAGSTTLQNMFFRFGLKHNLTILLPKEGNYVRNTTDLIEPRDGGHYDIFAIHTVYDGKFAQLLPPDAVYIGIVREPFDRMISAAYYYRDVLHRKYLRKVPANRFIQNLVNNPDIYDKGSHSNTKNTMSHDFGFSRSMLEANKTVIQQTLDRLNKEFRLVLVMESFDESLILMRRYLNWSVSDVIYLKTNTHSHGNINLSMVEKAKFRSTCFLDYAIYDQFKQEFDKKISQEGEDFWLEVEQFKRILMDVSTFCNINNCSKFTVNPSPWNEMFTVSSEDCLWMKTREQTFINSIRKRMLKNDTVVT